MQISWAAGQVHCAKSTLLHNIGAWWSWLFISYVKLSVFGKKLTIEFAYGFALNSATVSRNKSQALEVLELRQGRKHSTKTLQLLTKR